MNKVAPISGIYDHQQANSNHATHYIRLTPNNSNHLGMSFKECLKAQIQRDSNRAIVNQEEQSNIGIILSYFAPMTLMLRPEVKQTLNTNRTISDS